MINDKNRKWRGYEFIKEESKINLTPGSYVVENQDFLTELLHEISEDDNDFIFTHDEDDIENPLELYREFIDNEGNTFLITNNSVTKVLKKSAFTGTLTGQNEVKEVPVDSSEIHFVSKIIKR